MLIYKVVAGLELLGQIQTEQWRMYAPKMHALSVNHARKGLFEYLNTSFEFVGTKDKKIIISLFLISLLLKIFCFCI